MLKFSVLILQVVKLLLISLETVEFFFKMSNYDIFLIGLDSQGRYKLSRAHENLLLKINKLVYYYMSLLL